MTNAGYSRDSSGSRNPTDETDLDSSLHNLGGDVEDEVDADEAEIDATFDENGEELPQEITESYGTGVHELPGYNAGGRTMRNRAEEMNEATPELTGGDIDANYEQANAVGDESVGGTVSTPDMDIVDDLGKAVGLEMADANFLHTNDILEQRDDRRWELEPTSSEDYAERRDLAEDE
ncbi:MAG: hypothetical protein KME13_13185 [Myxacorys californica WJT36-NPBG1]|jgi:hypothetical protein|nr:hypothetical protein [Myxacorys californica WJT36-NPBG1]